MDNITPENFVDVFDRLERDGVRYVVIGGVAVVLHGHARAVADLDIVVDSAPAEAERAVQSLARAGFVPSIMLPPSMLTVLRMFDHAAREIDVFIRWQISFGELWADSERVRVGDGSVRIASLEHLLREKRISGRTNDIEAMEALLAFKARGSAPPS
jgi:hypothetical protein